MGARSLRDLLACFCFAVLISVRIFYYYYFFNASLLVDFVLRDPREKEEDKKQVLPPHRQE